MPSWSSSPGRRLEAVDVDVDVEDAMKMDEVDWMKHMIAEIHELNANILKLADEISRLKHYLVNLDHRIVWIQQKLGLRKMPRSSRDE